jgi:DUF4097 and DUF4098 domain-containing protein YvlB
MRRRSLVGPVFLILIGVLFLASNLRPDLAVFEIVSQYWPFLLIGWGLLRLMEVFFAARSGRRIPSGLSGGEIVLIVFICLIGSGMYAANRAGHGIHIGPWGPGSLEIFGEAYDYEVPEKTVAAGKNRLYVENLRGNIHITGTDDAEVTVNGRKSVRALNRREADAADKQTSVDVVTENDRIVVRTNQQNLPHNRRISIDLELSVPKNMTVETRGDYGDVEISQIQGPVEIDSDNAGVRLSDIGGDVRVNLRKSDMVRAVDVKGAVDLQGAKANDVELENIGGQVTINGTFMGSMEFKNLAKPLHFASQQTDLKIESVPGRVSMDLGEFTGKNLVGPVRLVTRSRDIRIEDFTNALELDTARGDIELRPDHVPLGKIEARSRSGNIDLELPVKARFELKASTSSGEARNDFGPAIQLVTDGRSASMQGVVGQGPAITLNTGRGSITVRKAGTEPAPGAPVVAPAPQAPPHPALPRATI